jgi:DNA-binding IclR family transcriptional regulator
MTVIKTASNAAESAVSSESQDSRQPDPNYSAPAVDRALDIIEHLAVDSRGRGVNELARELDIPVNSAYRVLQRLVDRGYVGVDDEGHQLTSRIYSLGLSLQARFDLKGRARPHLEALSLRTRLTCSLQIIDRGEVLLVDSVVPEADYWLAVRDGIRLEVTSSAFGKAMLPFLPKSEQKAILSRPRVKHTRNTLMTEAAIQSAMAEKR